MSVDPKVPRRSPKACPERREMDELPRAWTLDEALADLQQHFGRRQLTPESEEKIERLIAMFKEMNWPTRRYFVKRLRQVYKERFG